MACFKFSKYSEVKYWHLNYTGWNLENFNSNTQRMKETDIVISNLFSCHIINKPSFYQFSNCHAIKTVKIYKCYNLSLVLDVLQLKMRQVQPELGSEIGLGLIFIPSFQPRLKLSEIENFVYSRSHIETKNNFIFP